jgi:hypothetical protein
MTPDEIEALRDAIARAHDRLGLDCQTALVNLIDALRDCIRAEEGLADDLLSDGAISRKEREDGLAWLLPLRLVLSNLEACEFDPTLHGLIKFKKKA